MTSVTVTSLESSVLHGGVIEFIYNQYFICFDHICGLSVNRVL